MHRSDTDTWCQINVPINPTSCPRLNQLDRAPSLSFRNFGYSTRCSPSTVFAASSLISCSQFIYHIRMDQPQLRSHPPTGFLPVHPPAKVLILPTSSSLPLSRAVTQTPSSQTSPSIISIATPTRSRMGAPTQRQLSALMKTARRSP